MILLYCEYERGQVGFHKGNVEGVVAEARHYTFEDHLVRIEHEYEAVEAHDAAELLAHEIQGKPVYRLVTPAEQEVFTNKQQKTGNLRETKLEARLLKFPAKQVDDGKG